MQLILYSQMPSGLTFVPNTLTIDGVLQPNADPNTGVLLAILPPNEIYSIVFQVTVNNIPLVTSKIQHQRRMNLLLILLILRFSALLPTLHSFK